MLGVMWQWNVLSRLGAETCEKHGLVDAGSDTGVVE